MWLYHRCHSAGALLSLCFLAGAYEHAFALIQEFGTLPMGVEVLVQVRAHRTQADPIPSSAVICDVASTFSLDLSSDTISALCSRSACES
jgi:hypothetical protein